MKKIKKLLFITEARFYRDVGDNYYSDASFDITLWDRYLNFFDEINVVARVQIVNTNQLIELIKNDNPNVKFIPLPYFIGLKGLIYQRKKLIKSLSNSLRNANQFNIIIRVPGTIGYYAAKLLKQNNCSYHVEVVGDPGEVFSKGNFTHPLRPLLKKLAVYHLKYVIKNASSALYVTKYTLQKKYPLHMSKLAYGVSDVNISDELIVQNPKIYNKKKKYKIVSVGSLSQMYKAPDILLKAIKLVNSECQDFKVELVWLGDGIYKQSMINFSVNLGIQDSVNFKGNVSRSAVLNEMKSSDLFVLASRTEGLPRVVIEAMAMGLPIIATNVGGIPELLDTRVMVNKDDEINMATKILEILGNDYFYNEQSKLNLNNANFYKKSSLEELRNFFFLNF